MCIYAHAYAYIIKERCHELEWGERIHERVWSKKWKGEII